MLFNIGNLHVIDKGISVSLLHCLRCRSSREIRHKQKATNAISEFIMFPLNDAMSGIRSCCCRGWDSAINRSVTNDDAAVCVPTIQVYAACIDRRRYASCITPHQAPSTCSLLHALVGYCFLDQSVIKYWPLLHLRKHRLFYTDLNHSLTVTTRNLHSYISTSRLVKLT